MISPEFFISVEFVFGVGIGILFWFFRSLLRRAKYRKWREKKALQDAKFDLGSTDNQFRFLQDVELYPIALMNKEEKQVFSAIENMISQYHENCRVMAQPSMGEFIRTERKSAYPDQLARAFKAYNSKRVDMLIIDERGQPRVAVEYQGGMHDQGNAKGRDRVKAAALQKAGILLIEVFPSQLRDLGSFLYPIERALRVRSEKLENWRYLVREGKVTYVREDKT